MRRIFAIAIIALVVFLVVYGVFQPVKATVDDFMLNTMGPTFFNAITSVYTGVLATVGVGGFAAIVLGVGFAVGIFTHKMWVSADWAIRRWGQARTATDLGTVSTTSMPSTPLGATTRPATKEAAVPKEPLVTEEAKKQESEAT